jgi:hypothetical protein
MNKSIAAGAVGGLSGGIVFDALMRALSVRTGHESMITFATRVFDAAAHPMVGWFVYPIYGVVIGALFGLLLHAYTADDFTATLWGVSYGAIWWIFGELVLIPGLLGTWPFSTQGIQQMRNVAIPLLIGHLAYGVILGLVWGRGTIRPARPVSMDESMKRAA